MSFYSTLAAKSLALLTKFGQDAVLRAATAGDYDPNSSSVLQSNDNYTVKVAVFDDADGQTNIADGLTRMDQKKVLMQAGSRAPTINDTLIVGGITYGILSVKEINPAGTPVLYELRARRS